MAKNIETIGVKVVVDGANRAISDLNKVNRAIGSVGGQAATTASPLGVLAGALGNVATIAAGIISAQLIRRIAEGLKDMATGAIMGAARVEELEIILELLGTRAGYATTQLQGWRDAVVDAGIRTDVATKTIIEFIRYQMDATKAVELAALAQDAATISQEDSTEALAGLMHGILVQRSIVLRHHGVIVNIQKAFDDYAASIDKVTDDLSASERVQATLNAVLKQGVTITGAYEAAMTTAGKQLRSMPRFIYEFLRELGVPFLQSFADAIFTINEFIKALGVAVSEGGRLRPILDALAAAANRLLIPIVALAQVVSEWLGVTTKAATDTAKAMTEMSGKLAAVKGPDLASDFEDEARKILNITKGLTKSVTRMWEDFNRRLAQSTFDYNLGRLRDELDWARSQERNLEEHNRRMADLYADLQELRTGKRRQEIKAQMQAERKDYQGQRRELVALLKEAQSEEERLRIQGWVSALDAEHKANQDVLKEELDAINEEQRLLELRIAQEEAAFKRRRAIEAEDRRIRMAREEEDWQRRVARDEEAIKLRETRAKAEAAERIALVKQQIAEEKQARIDAYKEQAALLTESAETQKRIMEEISGKQKSLMEEWKEIFKGLTDALSAIDWAVLTKNFKKIADSLTKLNVTLGKLIVNLDESGASVENLGKPFEGLRLFIEGNIKWLSAWGAAIVTTIDIILTLLSEGPRAAARKLPELLGYLTDAVLGFVQILASIPYSIIEAVLGGIDAFRALFQREESHLKRDFQNWAQRMGDAFMAGMVDGINRGWQAVIDRIRDLAEAIGHEIRLRLGIGSPSRVFFAYGQEIVRGMAEGIRSLGDLPALQMGQVTLGTLAAVPASTTSISNTYNLNMSSIAPTSTVAADFHLMKVVAGP